MGKDLFEHRAIGRIGKLAVSPFAHRAPLRFGAIASRYRNSMDVAFLAECQRPRGSALKHAAPCISPSVAPRSTMRMGLFQSSVAFKDQIPTSKFSFELSLPFFSRCAGIADFSGPC